MKDMIHYAIQYARIRTDYYLASLEEKEEMEDSRTRVHNAFIDSCNILSRNMAKQGEDITWRELLGTNRKIIGDFACYIHCIIGIKSR